MKSPILPPPLQKLILDSIEGMVHLLSQAQHLNEFFAKIAPDSLDKLISSVPTWFSLYDLTPEQALMESLLPNSPPQIRDKFEHGMRQSDPFGHFLSEVREQGALNIQEMTKPSDEPPTINPEISDSELQQMGGVLSATRALANNARALAIYGQSVHEFVLAGKGGNDEGYLRAATIDPTIHAHPDVAQRVAKSLMKHGDDFAKQLRTAAEKGASKNILDDHNQLRVALSFLRRLGILKQLTDEQRYQLFCEELKLYDVTGKNPKAALCTFIDRWEKSLVV